MLPCFFLGTSQLADRSASSISCCGGLTLTLTITRIFYLKLRLVHHFPCHLHQLFTHSTKSNCSPCGELTPPHLRADLHFDSRNGPSCSAHPAHALSFPGWCSLLSPLSETFLPSFLSPTKAGCVPILSFRPSARRWEHHVNETLVCVAGGGVETGPWGHPVPGSAL